MAVAFDAIGAGGANTGGTTATITWSHTLSASATDIVVYVCDSGTGDGDTLTVKVGSTSMTSLGKVHANNQTQGFIQAFGLTSPPTGTQTITVTNANENFGGGNPGGGNSISFTGSNGYGTVYTNFGSGSSDSVTISSTTSGNLCTAGFGYGTAGGESATTGTLRFTQNTNTSGACNTVSGFTATSTGSAVTPTLSVTTADWWGAIGVEVVAATGGGSSGVPILQRPAPPGLNPFTHMGAPVILGARGGRSSTTYNQSGSATVTTTVTLIRQIGAIKSATVTTTPSLVKQIGAIKNATVTTGASLIRQIAAIKNATVTTTGSVIRSIGKIIPTVTVTTTSTVAAIKVKLVSVSATVTTTASLVRQVGKNAAATVTTSGSLQRALGKTVNATVSTAVSYVRGLTKTFSTTVSTTPTVVRGIGKNVSVTVTTTATASETKIPGGGWSSTVYGWLPFIPDEVALGQAVTLRVEFCAADGSRPALDTAPTARVIGWASGADTILAGPTVMTADGHSWTLTYTPTTKGPQALEVRGMLTAVTQFFMHGFTVRPQFDPIALAVSDTLVSRM